MKLNYFPKPELEFKVTDYVSKTILDIMKDNGVNIFLSGGSWVDLYEDIFSRLLEHDLDFSDLGIYQVDERYDADRFHKDSNQRIILNNVPTLKKLVDKGSKLRFIMNDESLSKTVQRYSILVKEALDGNDINVSLLGIGEDGHLAGIKPSSSVISADDQETHDENIQTNYTNMLRSKKYVCNYDAEDYNNRITLNFKALESFNKTIVYVSGNHKKKALEKIYENDRHLINNPVQILNLIPNTQIFTDVKIS